MSADAARAAGAARAARAARVPGTGADAPDAGITGAGLIDELLRALTPEEKISLLSGADLWRSGGVARLGIPPFKMSDGPSGVRGDGRRGSRSACFPAGAAIAASWDTALATDVGAALGREARDKNVHVVLGPTINLQRTPIGGRNFECCAEDPWLTGRIASAVVNGIQQTGVGACPKHFVCNDTEFERHTISSDVNERPLRELYLRPFEMVVRDARPWTIMSAYNKINGTYASSHRALLAGVLKGEWGFDGVVISDWGAALETTANANGGLDLEMPGPPRTWGGALLAAVNAGDVAMDTLDDKVRRLLRLRLRAGLLRADAPAPAPASTATATATATATPTATEDEPERSPDHPAHRALARRAAADSMVLMRNTGLLPLDPSRLTRLAVIGPNAAAGQIQGGGSASVSPYDRVSPLEGLRRQAGDMEIVHAPGCLIHKYTPAIDPARLRPAPDAAEHGLNLEVFANATHTGPPHRADLERHGHIPFFLTYPGLVRRGLMSARLTGVFTPDTSGAHVFGLASAGLARLFLDGAEIVDNWTDQSPGDLFFSFGSAEKHAEAVLEAGRDYALRIDFSQPTGSPVSGLRFGVLPPMPDDLPGRAVAAAAGADAVVFVAGSSADWETEGHDRADMSLPGRQQELIERVLDANPRTVVALNTGSPVDMPWHDRAAAVLQCWFPGQEFGNALADVLFGGTDPGGRMPLTVPRRLEDSPAAAFYPGADGHMRYGEGLFAGYRWYDARGITPRVPFGHGLSYTRFAYGALQAPARAAAGQAVAVSLAVTNAGERTGREVVQIYIRPPDGPPRRPVRELRDFAKIALAPGETQTLDFTLAADAFAHWEPGTGEPGAGEPGTGEPGAGWVVAPGAYVIEAGASSADIRTRAEIVLDSR